MAANFFWLVESVQAAADIVAIWELGFALSIVGAIRTNATFVKVANILSLVHVTITCLSALLPALILAQHEPLAALSAHILVLLVIVVAALAVGVLAQLAATLVADALAEPLFAL